MASVKGKDECGGNSYISVNNKDGKIHVFSPEDARDVVFTKKQAKELIKLLEACINEEN